MTLRHVVGLFTAVVVLAACAATSDGPSGSVAGTVVLPPVTGPAESVGDEVRNGIPERPDLPSMGPRPRWPLGA